MTEDLFESTNRAVTSGGEDQSCILALDPSEGLRVTATKYRTHPGKQTVIMMTTPAADRQTALSTRDSRMALPHVRNCQRLLQHLSDSSRASCQHQHSPRDTTASLASLDDLAGQCPSSLSRLDPTTNLSPGQRE